MRWARVILGYVVGLIVDAAALPVYACLGCACGVAAWFRDFGFVGRQLADNRKPSDPTLAERTETT